MRELWQKFLRLIPDAEGAAAMLLVAVISAVTVPVFIVYLFARGHYFSAGTATIFSMLLVLTFIRDFRRERYSLASVILLVLWMLLTGAALAYGYYAQQARNNL